MTEIHGCTTLSCWFVRGQTNVGGQVVRYLNQTVGKIRFYLSISSGCMIHCTLQKHNVNTMCHETSMTSSFVTIFIILTHWGRDKMDAISQTTDTFKPIFVNENIRFLIKISLKFVPKVPINNIPALIQIMALRRPGDKPLSEAMMVCLLTHICVTKLIHDLCFPLWLNKIVILR